MSTTLVIDVDSPRRRRRDETVEGAGGLQPDRLHDGRRPPYSDGWPTVEADDDSAGRSAPAARTSYAVLPTGAALRTPGTSRSGVRAAARASRRSGQGRPGAGEVTQPPATTAPAWSARPAVPPLGQPVGHAHARTRRPAPLVSTTGPASYAGTKSGSRSGKNAVAPRLPWVTTTSSLSRPTGSRWQRVVEAYVGHEHVACRAR